MTVSYSYDANDRLVDRAEAIYVGRTAGFPPTPIANVEHIAYTYDLAGRQLTMSGGPATYALDVTAVFDAAPTTLTKCMGGGTVTLQNRGWRLASIVRNGTELQFGYDTAGRLSEEARKDSGGSCYHVFGRTYTDNGQLETLIYPSGRIVEYVYPSSPANGDVDRPIRITVLTRPGRRKIIIKDVVFQAGVPVEWTTSSNLKTTVSWRQDGNLQGRLLQDCSGGPCTTTHFNWVVSSRDHVGNPTTIDAWLNDAQVQTQQMSYTTDPYEMGYALNGGSPGYLGYRAYSSMSLGYTASGERETEGFPPNRYYYDGFKLQSYVPANPSNGTTTFSYVGADTRIQKAVRETIFETTTLFAMRYTVDGLADYLTQNVGGSRRYAYDGLGRRASWRNGLNGVFAYEFWSDNRIMEEIGYNSTSEPNPRPVYDYIYIGNERVALLTGTWDDSDPSNGLVDGSVYFTHNNHLGATVLVTDTSRTDVLTVDYGPFGDGHESGSISLRPRLPGQLKDAFYVTHNGYRTYHEGIGQYLQPEPIMQNPRAVARIALSGTPFNAYTYAAGNPIRYGDPTGLEPIKWDHIQAGGNPVFTPAPEGSLARSFEVGMGHSIAALLLLLVDPLAGVMYLADELSPYSGTNYEGEDAGSQVCSVNPFKGKTPAEVDRMLRDRGFTPKGPDPLNGLGGYENPATGRSYHIDPNHPLPEGPHVDVNRRGPWKTRLPKWRLPMRR